jgi:phospholipase C
MLPHSLSDEKKAADPIKHVIVLMLENKSFDQMLGSLQKIKPELDGVAEDHLHFNIDFDGNKIYQQVTTTIQMELDPYHEVPNVAKQLSQNNGGFIQDFISNYPSSSASQRQDIMGYYPLGFLPALHALGTEFTVCDRWFASVPGPTWPNRFFALSGTSMGRVTMPEKSKDPDLIEIFYQRQESIFDRLNEKKISWRTYCGDFPISLVLAQNRRPDNLIHYRKMEQFYKDVNGSVETFPEFTFIEPTYLGENQNDDHPPHNTMKAQKLIADVYNAIRAKEELWKQCLFIVTYDEHGGFYDHVVPPAAQPPDEQATEGFDFKQLGVRVPAILISPWVKKPVEKTVFDHTSILKYLINKWQLAPLRERTSKANSIEVALDFTDGPREDCLAYINVPSESLISPKPFLEKHDLNHNHLAMHAFAEFLNQKNSLHIAPIAESSTTTKFKDKVGKKLEGTGLIKIGMWCRKANDTHQQKQIARTLKIVETCLENSPSSHLHLSETSEAETKPTPKSRLSFSRCTIL